MKKFINIAILLAGVASLTSCLKDKKENLDPNGSPAVVEWSTTVVDLAPVSPSGAVYPMYNKAFELVATANFDLQVGLTGGAGASSATTVNVSVDAASLAKYNTEQGTSYVILDPSMYSVPTSTTIAQGQTKGTFTVTLKPNLFDLTKAYVIPLKITSVSNGGTISKNYGTIMFNVAAKNKYDGIYTLTGDFTDANGVYKGSYPAEVQLITVDASTVDLLWSDYGNYYYIITNISTGGAANAGATRFHFDTATDKVSSITTRANAAFGTLVSGGPNQYTASSKKFVINYTFPTTNRFKANDTYTFKRAR